MSDHPQAIPGRSLEIRVSQDGAKVHIRADVFEGPVHVCHRAEREKLPALLGTDGPLLAQKVVTAIHDALCEQPLF